MKRALNWLPAAAAYYAVVGGLITVLGWMLDLPRLADWTGDGIAMQPNTAVLAMISGVSLLSISPGVRRLGGILLIVAGTMTLVENLTGFDVGIDRLLLFGRTWGSRATMVPGRMGIPASTSWALIGVALVVRSRVDKESVTVPLIGLIISCIASLSVIGYLLGADILYAWPRFTAIAFQTATILLSIGVALIATASDAKPVRTLAEDSAGGALARRGLPIVIILPFLMGLIYLRGHMAGLYDAPMAVALLVLSLIITLCAVLWWGVNAVTVREESLRRSEERFSRFMEQLPGLAWIKDRFGRYEYVNEAAEKVFGASRTFLQGKTDAEIFPPATAEQFRQNDAEAILNSKGVQIVETLKHDDGVVHHSIVSKFPIADSQGDVAMVGGIAIDVTDRMRAEQTVTTLLRISKQLNSTLSIDGLLDILTREAIHLVGAQAGLSGLLTQAGIANSKYFRGANVLPIDYSRDSVQKLPGWLIGHKAPCLTNDAASDPRVDQRFCERYGVRAVLAVPIITAQGDVIGFFEVHNKVDGLNFTSLDQELLVAVSQIAAIAVQNALAYQSLQEAKRSLQASDRRKDEFLAVMAHELRNPLAPIRNGLEILKRSTGDAQIQTSALSAMDRQVAHMVRLVDDLLDLSRVSHGKLELRKEFVDLEGVVRQAAETALPMASQRHQQIRIALPPEPIELNVDPVRMAQVINNLLNNACKFSPPGSDIEMSVIRDNSDALICVKDHGQGIAAENLDRIFEMFAQLHSPIDRSHGGLGIGLALARRMVEMHAGSITAASDGPGRGSTFQICLPIAVKPPSNPPQSKDGAVSRAIQAARVLVVDDNRDAATTLAMIMKCHGHEVAIAHDGAEACQVAESYRPLAILLDIGLPGMNGHEACREIRQRPWGKNVTIIALTGWGQDEDRRLSEEAGFDGHLVKPVEYDALTEMLSEKLCRPDLKPSPARSS